MRTYTEIATIMGRAYIENQSKKGYYYLLGLIHGMKKRKASKGLIGVITQIHIMTAEGHSIEEIFNEIQLGDPETWGKIFLQSWTYPTTINLDGLRKFPEMMRKEIKIDVSDEEYFFFLSTNIVNAFRLAMLK